jgi:hypothetical protein
MKTSTDGYAACIMCNEILPKGSLDYVGRCDECFKKYMQMKDEEKPNLGIPFSKKINYDWPN